MKIDLITIFPGIFDGPFRESMIKRAVDRGLININLVDLRDYTEDRHRQVDDTPFGGGYGMVLKPEPIFNAVEALKETSPPAAQKRVILMSPQGRTFNQQIAFELAALDHLILICGRYEGVDERVREALVDDQLSIGDYVLTGGELAAAVVVDAVARLVPGFLAEEASKEESFSEQLLEYPHYTKPRAYRGMEVPPVLLSGNHQEIAAWRRRQSLARTLNQRPDLLKKARLDEKDLEYLEKLKKQL